MSDSSLLVLPGEEKNYNYYKDEENNSKTNQNKNPVRLKLNRKISGIFPIKSKKIVSYTMCLRTRIL